MIFKFFILFFSKVKSLKYQRSTTLGCKDVRNKLIRKLDFELSNQFLYLVFKLKETYLLRFYDFFLHFLVLRLIKKYCKIFAQVVISLILKGLYVSTIFKKILFPVKSFKDKDNLNLFSWYFNYDHMIVRKCS